MLDKLIEYSKLIVNYGVNLQKGQTLVLRCPADSAAFGRLIAEAAYEAGAREVVVFWSDDQLERLRFLRADNAVFDEIPKWVKTLCCEYAGKKAALVVVSASDPEYLKGVDSDRLRRFAITKGRELKEYQQMLMHNEFPWCGVSVPSAAWALKVFPGYSPEEAVEKLWDVIFHAVRVTGDGGANRRWEEHINNLSKRVKILDEYNFSRLVYKNSLGTDLSVELPEGHRWICCGEKAKTGTVFLANMPTEEIFTLPKKDGVNGVVYSSVPLSLDGNLVKDICFTIKNGKITDVSASAGLETLTKKLEVDEGARYLGEAALVPHKSPISDMGILFYNTLYDENASCHFAFGKAYPCFTDAETASTEELIKRGLNDSAVHVDFMIGTPDLSITGFTHDGREVPVFVNGNFSF